MAKTAKPDNFYRFERITEGTQDYLGPVHRRSFGAVLTRRTQDSALIEADNLVFMIETSSDPWGGARHRNNDEAFRVASDIKSLLGRDERAQDALILRQLNADLTVMRTPQVSLMRLYSQFRDAAGAQSDRMHPMTTMVAATFVAQRPYRQEHATVDDVLRAASHRQRGLLERKLAILQEPNEGIDVTIQARGGAAPTILIQGPNMPDAFAKLQAMNMLDAVGTAHLSRELGEWAEQNPKLTAFNREVRAVVKILDALDPYGTAPFRRNTVHVADLSF